MKRYEELVAEAVAAPLAGWDFSYLGARLIQADPPWSYYDRATDLVINADGPVLDMSAGGAELSEGADDPLPFSDGRFSVLLNRHDTYQAKEIWRVLRSGGAFLTQQVGGLDGLTINEALGAPLPHGPTDWALNNARAELEDSGLTVTAARTAFPERLFRDVGALIYFLRAAPRQVPDFSVEKYDKELRILHEQMSGSEPFRDRSVRFIIEAVKP
ncbi:MAG: hypothetical protein ACRDT8_18560 [Micromonosporaceae bacterium]